MKRSDERLIIYQLFPRIITNDCAHPEPWGTYEQNGAGKMNDITPTLLRSIRSLGVNCIWYTGIIEHATKTAYPGIPADNPRVVKGESGSPYAIKDYYDVAPEIAVDTDNRMGEFESLVNRTHRAGMKVIIDFVPNHTARVYKSDCAPIGIRDFGADDDVNLGFSPRNDYYYCCNQQFAPCFDAECDEYREFPAKATGNDCFSAFPSEYDWYETVKLNYGYDYVARYGHYDPIPPVWLKMLNILMFWASKGIDGFRCDMVFMVPREFWHWAIAAVKTRYPHIIFIGEIYDVAMYRDFLGYCGFDYLYDKVNLYDTLVGIERHNISAAKLTECWQKVDGIGQSMLNFLENHDEVRYASPEFAGDPRRVTPALVTSSMMSKGPFMLYYGQELGEPAADNEGFAGCNNRTTIFDYWSLATLRAWNNGGKWNEDLLTEQQRWLRARYSLILRLCNKEEALRSGAFFDLMYANLQNAEFNPHTTYAFLRYTPDDALLIIANFGDRPENVRINVPQLCHDLTGLPEGEIKTRDLLTGRRLTISIADGCTSHIPVGSNDAIVLKINTKTDDKKIMPGRL